MKAEEDDRMAAGAGSRITIGRMMAVIAGCGVVLAVVVTPGFGPVLGMVTIASTIVGLVAYLLGRRLVELAYGHRCPGCGARGLERRGVVAFGERFFLCPRCGVRCRRSLLGFYGMFAWRDASAPAYDSYYQKAPGADPWNLPPGVEDEDEAFVSKTHLSLVRNKRRRSPENPNGPGLE